MFLQFLALLSMLTSFTHGQVSEHSGVDWSQTPESLIPDNYVDPATAAAVRAAAAAAAANAEETMFYDSSVDPIPFTTPEIRNFLEAAGFGNEEEMQSSLDAGVDVNSVESRSGDTALHQATWGNHHEAVKFLLKNDADPNIKNLAGYTPLLLATRKEEEGSLAIMKTLLMRGGAEPWATNNNGNTALHWAAHLGRKDVTEWLLGEDNVSIDMPNNDGLTPLMLAATSGKDQLVKLLIENSASFDMVEPNFGRTSLELASAKGNSRVVQLLLKNGADWQGHKDTLGDNALELARLQGHTQVEFLLQGRDPLTGEEIEQVSDDEAAPTDM